MTLTTHTHNDLIWLDLEKPTREEAMALIEEYGVAPAVAEELLVATRKPRIEVFDTHLFIVLHFPALKHSHQGSTLQEVDFIIGKNFLITARYDSVDALHKFAAVLDTDDILRESPPVSHAGFLFYFLIKKLYRSLEHELEDIESELEAVEARIFAGRERDMVHRLSVRGRDLTDFRKALGYHDEVLETLEHAGAEFFGADFAPHVRRIHGEYRRIEHQLAAEHAFFTELRETNNSLLTTKQNEVMKTLTILAFITLPLSLITGLFGMNTAHTPFVESQYGFWLIIALLLAILAALLGYFKYRKWL